MDIRYTNDLPDKSEFYKLFITTGWNESYKLNEDELYSALENSWYSISAYEGEKLVGFGRVICDGIVHALILDMIVLPEYQNKGIGGVILEDIVAVCRKAEIRDIQLFCAKGKKGFYNKYSFVSRPDDAPGMQWEIV